MSHIKFDIAEENELRKIVDMKLAMHTESGMKLGTNQYQISNLIINDYIKLYENKEARHFEVRCNDRIIASVGAFIKTDLPFRYFAPHKYGFIGDVYTDVDFRKRGFATKLMTEALDWLKANEVKMVRLFTSDSAQKIYKELGFVPGSEMFCVFKT